MCVSIGQKVSLISDQKILIAAYSKRYQLVAACDQANQVRLFGWDGQEKLKLVRLDDIDEVLML
jgi:hypothetical protein